MGGQELILSEVLKELNSVWLSGGGGGGGKSGGTVLRGVADTGHGGRSWERCRA